MTDKHLQYAFTSWNEMSLDSDGRLAYEMRLKQVLDQEAAKEKSEKMPEEVQVNDKATPTKEASVEELEAENIESEWDKVNNKDNILGKVIKILRKSQNNSQLMSEMIRQVIGE